MRTIASSVLLCLLVTCSSTTEIERLEEDYLGLPPAQGPTYRVLILPFLNSASMEGFDIIADQDYSLYAGSDKESEQESVIDETDPDIAELPEPAHVNAGEIASEVTETLMFQTGRFEILTAGQIDLYPEGLAEGEIPDTEDLLRRIAGHDIDFLVYGDLTNFEISQDRSYWKVPLWALILAVAVLSQDDDLRMLAMDVLIRLLVYVPLNSPFWDQGIGWQDIELNVDLALNIRMVDPHTGSIVFSQERDMRRTERVRNLEVLVWQSDNSVKVSGSSAGRQIRYLAGEIVRDMAMQIDRISGHRYPENSEN